MGILWAMMAMSLAGCRSPLGNHVGEGAVFSEIEERAGAADESLSRCSIDPVEWVDWEDGLSEDEAALLALARNARFQELLADLGLTWADLVIAGQLPNPQVTTMFPVSAKDFEFALAIPFDVVLSRPHRIDAAAWQSRRIGKRLVQDGLNVIRDAKVAHADAWLAGERRRLADENSRLREETARLTAERERGGDASPLDVATAQLDAVVVREATTRLVFDERLAWERLRLAIGAGPGEPTFALARSAAPSVAGDVDALVQEALASRPDMAAATFALDEAQARTRLALYDNWFARLFLPDINSPGENGFEAGPGLQFILPIFHQNQGARARAEADAERLSRQRRTLHDTIVFEVRSAHLRLQQSRASLSQLNADVLPLAVSVSSVSERAFQEGAQSLVLALESNRRLLEAQLRAAESQAELRRATAELERSVGRKLPSAIDVSDAEAVSPESGLPPNDSPRGELLPPPAMTEE